PGLRRLVHAMPDVPAVLLGRFGDILAWNRLGHALIAGHVDFAAPERPATRPNSARLVVLDPHTRDLYPDWPVKAREDVAYLRAAASRYPDDPQLAALVGELSVKSQEFATLWAAPPVREKRHGARPVTHPVVGAMTLTYEVLHLPDDGYVLTTFTAEPGTASEAALQLLAGLTASGRAEDQVTGPGPDPC
ncbi:MAG: transcriptional regulator, partial [Streptomycetaceae bacterium]|nr:transcriptional regulator [Streptomycetaceae bacterium]